MPVSGAAGRPATSSTTPSRFSPAPSASSATTRGGERMRNIVPLPPPPSPSPVAKRGQRGREPSAIPVFVPSPVSVFVRTGEGQGGGGLRGKGDRLLFPCLPERGANTSGKVACPLF